MASSYSSDLKLELMATGENAGTWGDKTNTNLNLIQQAVAGFEQVTLSSGGTLALVMSDGAASNARNMVIKFATASIAASTVCTIPDSIEKFYIFDATGLTNPSNLTIKTASGSGFTLDQAKIYAAYSDGTNLKEISLDTLGGTVAAANITGTIATSQIADDAITSAKIADDAVVTAAIADDAVATANIADDAVTADKLANTTVSAGSYTSAAITVDAQGRLTAASSGSAGAGAAVPLAIRRGPASGNLTVNPAANALFIYLGSGGGGGGGGSPGHNNIPQRPQGGGAGVFGFKKVPVTGGTPYPFNAGAQGNGGGTRSSGNPGGSSQVGNLFVANAGNGGSGANLSQSPGNSGSFSPVSADLDIGNSTEFLFEDATGSAGNAGNYQPGNPGNPGGAGCVFVYDNSGS